VFTVQSTGNRTGIRVNRNRYRLFSFLARAYECVRFSVIITNDLCSDFHASTLCDAFRRRSSGVAYGKPFETKTYIILYIIYDSYYEKLDESYNVAERCTYVKKNIYILKISYKTSLFFFLRNYMHVSRENGIYGFFLCTRTYTQKYSKWRKKKQHKQHVWLYGGHTTVTKKNKNKSYLYFN